MDPVRLQIENYCSIATADISFDSFSSALVVGKIKGSDKFSNGAGKSTIFAAIKYVLFNEIEFSILDKVVRRGTDFCKVTFDFKSPLDNEIYRISRSKSKKSGSEVRLYKDENGAWEDKTSRRNPDTEKDIAKIIKINYKTFCNSVLFSQSDLSGLASVTAGDRKKLLKDALQLNIYSKYESVAKKRAADLFKEIEKSRTILSTIGSPEEDIIKLNTQLNEFNEIISSNNKLLEVIKFNHDKEYDKYSDFMKSFEALERKSSESLTGQKLLKDELDKLCASSEDYAKKINVIKNTGKVLVEEIKDLNENLSKLKSLKLKSKEDVNKDYEFLTKGIIDNNTELNSLSITLKNLKVPLPDSGTCNHCRQAIVFDRKTCQEAIDSNIKITESKISNIKKVILDIEEKIKITKEELINIDTTLSSIELKTQSLNMKEKEVESKRSIYSEFIDLLDKNKVLIAEKTLALDMLKKNSFSDALTEEFSALKLSINNSKSRVLSFKREIEDINKNIVALSNNKAIIIHKIESRTDDISKISDFKSNIISLESKYSVHQKVIQAFGPTGIPALITHTILDDFQAEANIWLAKFRPGLQCKFSVIKDRGDGDKDDTLDISYFLEGNDLEYLQLSGAQKLIASLSLKLGLASVIKKRLGVDIKLLLIDEVDQSIDEGGLEAFENTIKQLQKDFKILLITHNKDLKDKFNSAIVVEQDENSVSTARVVNNW